MDHPMVRGQLQGAAAAPRSAGWRPAGSDTTPIGTPKPKLLDRLREALRSRHYSRRTDRTYCHWVERFVFFHNARHPAEMAEPEINTLSPTWR